MDAQSIGKSQEAVEHMLARAGGDFFVSHQPLQFARAHAIKSQLHTSADAEGNGAGPQCQLQMQQHIEFSRT